MVERFFKYYLLILPGIIMMLIALIIIDNPGYTHRFWQSAAPRYVYYYLEGRHPTGVSSGKSNRLDFSRLEPGDILLAGNSQSCYGHFTHAGIYLGEGRVLEGYVDCGISRQPLDHYRSYDWACILRVRIPEAKRRQAVEYALKQEFKTFYPAAFKGGENYWNCTKLIWEAFRRQGVDLDSFGDLWVTPDYIFRSPHVELVAGDGELPL